MGNLKSVLGMLWHVFVVPTILVVGLVFFLMVVSVVPTLGALVGVAGMIAVPVLYAFWSTATFKRSERLAPPRLPAYTIVGSGPVPLWLTLSTVYSDSAALTESNPGTRRRKLGKPVWHRHMH